MGADNTFGGGHTSGPVLEPREVAKRAVESALSGYGYFMVPHTLSALFFANRYAIYTNGLFNWRGRVGLPPLLIGRLEITDKNIRLQTFGKNIALEEAITKVADWFDFTHDTTRMFRKPASYNSAS